MSDDYKNAFERRKVPTTRADDQKNRFQRHDEVVAARRADTGPHDARVQKIADDNARWVRRNFQPTATGGTPLPPDLAALKTASDADREARRNPAPPRVIRLSAWYAVARVWHLETPNGQRFFDDDFNRTSMNNAMQTRLANGDDVSVEMVERSYQDCVRGNHLMQPYRRDPETGGRITVRGAKMLAPPTVYPPHQWPDEMAVTARENEEKLLRANSEDAARAMSLTFADLQREVRAKFNPHAVPRDVVGGQAV